MSVRVSAWAWQQDCGSTGAKLVLLALADSANDDGRCWPGISRIARMVHLSVGQVRRHLDRLEQAGLIARTRRRAQDGTLGGYDYQLLVSSAHPCAVDRRVDAPSSAHPCASPARIHARSEPSKEPSPPHLPVTYARAAPADGEEREQTDLLRRAQLVRRAVNRWASHQARAAGATNPLGYARTLIRNLDPDLIATLERSTLTELDIVAVLEGRRSPPAQPPGRLIDDVWHPAICACPTCQETPWPNPPTTDAPTATSTSEAGPAGDAEHQPPPATTNHPSPATTTSTAPAAARSSPPAKRATAETAPASAAAPAAPGQEPSAENPSHTRQTVPDAPRSPR